MSESVGVAITTVLITLVIVDIVGNSLVFAIIKRNRGMRYVCRAETVKLEVVQLNANCVSHCNPFCDLNISWKREKLE